VSELTILMPCLNEAETLETCIVKARTFLATSGVDGDVLIGDNGSTDGSQDIARSAGARVVDIPTRGYGAALIGGIAAADSEFVIMGDADDSYDFSDLMPFVEHLRDGADLVMGNRFEGGIEPGAMPKLHRYLGNPVLSFVGRLFFKTPIGDFHCGLRGFRRASMLELELRTTGMEFASEMVVKATLADLRVDEVPTTLRPDGRTRPPHLSTWKDGWRHLRFLLLYSPRWLFMVPGIVLGSVGLLGMLLLGTAIWVPGRGDFPTGLLVACGGMVIVAFQAMLFSMLAHDFAVSEGLLPPRMTNELLRQRPVFEHALVAGSLVTLVGLVGLVVSLVMSVSSDPVALDATPALRLGICSVVLCVVGLQCALGGAFMSVLRIKRIGLPLATVETPVAADPAREPGS
jgi:hypothetical protein